jgi:3-methyladenine DNA glycosylase AlkD
MADFHSKISIIVDRELRRSGNKEFAQRRDRLIGEETVSYGVKTSEIRKIVKKYWKKHQGLKEPENYFETASELISTKVLDDQMAGIFLLGLSSKTFEIRDISKLKKLIARYIDNWATCDAISSEVIAKILGDSPEKIEILDTWAKSKNKWLRRVALVTVVKLKNKIEYWNKIASRILSLFSEEKEPIVKSAVRWLEKEIG